MSLTRQQKENVIQSTADTVQSAVAVVFASYDALSVVDMNDLRGKLFDAKCTMRVVPKRLLRLAAQQAKLDFDPTQHEGQLAVIAGDDPTAPARILYDFAKEHEQVSIVAGTLEGDTLSQRQAEALAKLPTRDQLLGQLVSVLAGPMRGVAGALSGVPRTMVYVLSSIQEAKES